MDPHRLMIVVANLFFCLAGCGRSTLQTVESVASADETNRLIRRSWETVSRSNPDEKSYDFHSLVWQQLKNGVWVDHATLAKADFQRGSAHRRWISEIHHFDAEKAIAVLKIAEGNAPENSGAISYIYSWRTWDVKNNREIATIHICDGPFEPYTPPDIIVN